MDSYCEFHLYLYGPNQGPIESSFEQAEARLNRLPKLHFEPDGSFVWALDEGRQQVFGMIYDAAERIQYCELRGCCSLTTWCELSNAIIGDRSDGHVILKLREGLLQDLPSFQRTQWPVSD